MAGPSIARAALLFVLTGVSACGLDASGLDTNVLVEPDAETGPPPIEAGPEAGPPLPTSHVELVSGGTITTSTSYKVFVTLGQGPADQHRQRSPSYVVVGGVAAATQKK